MSMNADFTGKAEQYVVVKPPRERFRLRAHVQLGGGGNLTLHQADSHWKLVYAKDGYEDELMLTQGQVKTVMEWFGVKP